MQLIKFIIYYKLIKSNKLNQMKLLLKCIALICILQLNYYIHSTDVQKSVKKNLLKQNDAKELDKNRIKTSSNDAPSSNNSDSSNNSADNASSSQDSSDSNSKQSVTITNTLSISLTQDTQSAVSEPQTNSNIITPQQTANDSTTNTQAASNPSPISISQTVTQLSNTNQPASSQPTVSPGVTNNVQQFANPDIPAEPQQSIANNPSPQQVAAKSNINQVTLSPSSANTVTPPKASSVNNIAVQPVQTTPQTTVPSSSSLRPTTSVVNNFAQSVIQNLATSKNPATQPTQNLGICYTNINNHIYDLSPLSKLYDKNYTIKTLNNKTITFDFCKNINTKCSKLSVLAATDDCEKLAGSYVAEKNWIVENVGDTSKLTLQLSDGDNCNKITYEITCKPDKFLEIMNDGQIDTNKCGKTIKMQSKYACPVGIYTPWYSNLRVGKYFVATLMIILGIFFLFFGTAYSSFTITIIIGACFALLLYSLLKNTLKIYIGGYFILGYLIAMLIPLIDDKDRSLQKFSSIIILGFMGGGILYTCIVGSIKVNPYVLWWVSFSAICIVSLVIWGIIGKHIISLCTSLVGSYLIVRSIGIFFNNYPDEGFMSQLVRRGEYHQIRRTFSKIVILYLCAIITVCILGTIYQGVTDKDEPKKEKKLEKPVESEIENSNNNA